MDLQYFLEMVDAKHRYGSNLRIYHNYWKTAEVNQNFFYWLDSGEGKDIELPTCSREQLEKEQVRYLSREERLAYLVNIDRDGRLIWAKNGERITTDSEKYRDSLEGIVPVDDNSPVFRNTTQEKSSDESESNEDEVKRHIKYDLKATKGLKTLAFMSPATVFNHLLRHSVKGGRHGWIFVCQDFTNSKDLY